MKAFKLATLPALNPGAFKTEAAKRAAKALVKK